MPSTSPAVMFALFCFVKVALPDVETEVLLATLNSVEEVTEVTVTFSVVPEPDVTFRSTTSPTANVSAPL